VSAPALAASLALTVGDGARRFSLSVDLELARGVLVLFGPSGVGKTLTLAALAGLVRGVRGLASIDGVALLDSERGVDLPAHARRIGYVPQQHALFPFLDVAGNVGFGLPRAERRGPAVMALLDELGLGPLAEARIDGLSGGERQRVALGRALAVSPRLLLLDEPFASLDDDARDTLLGVVRASIDRRGIPAVLVTHDAGEATALGDWLVRFSRGRTESAGPPRAMLARGRVTIAGTLAAPADATGDGNAVARLDGATVAGPARLLAGDAGAAIRIELPADSPAAPRG
jgi:molybdate transport system ATP-binding protein